MNRLLLGILLTLLLPLSIRAQEVLVYETEIPILIDREDNDLFEIRVDSPNGGLFNNLTLALSKDVHLEDIHALKLYYAGTESAVRKEQDATRPALEYVPRNEAGKTRKANLTYSILKSEATPLTHDVTLSANQQLFPGTNYFWVSIAMKPGASILNKITADISSIHINGIKTPFTRKNKVRTHYLGVGVRHAGDDGSAAYRIPGIATTLQGTLLGVYDIRWNSSKDLQEFIEIGVSRSTDKGQTWEPMRIAMTMADEGSLPKAQNGVGDPAILVDETTGTIWVVAAYAHGQGRGASWTSSQPGMDADHTCQLLMVKSEDDGKTWSKPINLTEQLKSPEWHYLLQGPGRGITMSNGTLVFAGQFIDAQRVPNACIMYSKDHGKTWDISKLARTNTTEAQVAELEPGVLMLNMRDNRGGSRAVSTTTDMGESWYEHKSSRSALKEPICMASLISVKAKDNILGKDLLLFSNPNHTKQRQDITIKISFDGGYTWPEESQIKLDAEPGWGYSCLTMIDRETVGILYESSAAQMTFQAIKLRDFIH